MPSKARLPFSSFHDPGAIGDCGRYNGMPIPYGSADFDAPEEEEHKIHYIFKTVRPHLAILKELGADAFRLHISYHADSGSVGFSAEELRLISNLECDMPIDLYIEKEKCLTGAST